jgi:hypothetical protein
MIPAALLVIFLATTGVFAQEPRAVAVFAEGYSFFVSRQGEDREDYYDVVYDDIIGMEFYEGDYISTEEGTFLELQLLPSRNVLKIAENSSFLIGRLGDTGGGRFNVTYGRVRAKIDRLTGADTFKLLGPSVVAGVRGTDFGYDILATSDAGETGTVVRVYCFEGEVEVSKLKDTGETPAPGETLEEPLLPSVPREEISEEDIYGTVILRAGRMIDLPLGAGFEESPFVPRDVDEEIETFWRINDFSGRLVDVEIPAPQEVERRQDPAFEEPEVEQDTEVAEVAEVFTDEELETLRRPYIRAGSVLLGVGFVVEAVGIITTFFGESLFPGADPAFLRTFGRGMMITGGGFGVLSLFTYLGALRYQR